MKGFSYLPSPSHQDWPVDVLLPHEAPSQLKTEISLHILAYNMKRVMAVLGAKTLMNAIRA